MKRKFVYLFSVLSLFLSGNCVNASPPNPWHNCRQMNFDSRHNEFKGYLNEKPDLKSTCAIQNSILSNDGSVSFPLKGHEDITITGMQNNIDLNELDTSQPLFIKQPTVISGNSSEELSKVTFDRLTIFNCDDVVFENLDIDGQINITARANVIFRNCRIKNTTSGEFKNSAVSVIANSSSTFENCRFESTSSKVDVSAEANSYIGFDKCSMLSKASSILVLNSYFRSSDCTFENEGYSILLDKNCKSVVEDCLFKSKKAESKFIHLSSSEMNISNCRFEKDEKLFRDDTFAPPAIRSVAGSKIKLQNCKFFSLPGSCIHAVDASRIDATDCEMNNIMGNGIVGSFHEGTISGCKFELFNYPSIMISGKNSKPVIENCQIKNCKDKLISIKNMASPTIRNIHVSGMKENRLAVISDFSNPVIDNITFDANEYIPEIVVYGGAKPKIKMSEDIIVTNSNRVIQKPKEGLRVNIASFEFGEPILCDEQDSLEPEKLDISKIEYPSCTRGEHNCYISHICGHTVEKGQEKCLMCSEKIHPHSSIRVFSTENCLICANEEKPNTIFIPCGHKCCCFECANRCNDENGHKCPICSKRINSLRYDFDTEK